MLAPVRPIGFVFFVFILLTLLYTSCGDSESSHQLDAVEAVIEEYPDSALAIIQSIDPKMLNNKEKKARYSLLHAMALDKNYIDTADMSVIQPAIEWYSDHGTADERLKAMYYAGCIAGNGGDKDAEMGYYVKASKWIDGATDTLAICRLLMAQSFLYSDIYDLKAEIANAFQTAQLSEAVQRYDYAFYSYQRILASACGMEDSVTARQALNGLIRINGKWHEEEAALCVAKLQFATSFDNSDSIRQALENISTPYSEEDVLGIVQAYEKLHRYPDVINLLSQIPIPSEEPLRIRYLIATLRALAGTGNWQQAFEVSMRYNSLCDSVESRKFAQRLQFSEEKYGLELAALEARNAKMQLLYQSITIILSLAIIVVILLTLYRSNRRKRLEESQKRQIEEQKRQIAENDANLAQVENTKLRLEAQNLKLEQEKFQMLADTMQAELDELQEILTRKDSLNAALIEPLRRRSAMLDRFLISEITDNKQLGKTFQKWVDELTANRQELLKDMRLAFQVQHPDVYDNLLGKGLTEVEMSYVCLYALGLRGSEVGEVLGTTRHYVVSSEIRHKLGLDVHKENLGPYIQKLLKQGK